LPISKSNNYVTNTEFYKKLLDKFGVNEIVNSDEQLEHNDNNSMKKHNAHYDDLLGHYVKNIINTQKEKNLHKKVFFGIICGVLVAISLLFIIIMILCSVKVIEDNILQIIVSSSLSFLATFIILPQIITNYLFNAEEEKNIASIIKNIQDYDKEIRKNLLEIKIKNMLKRNELEDNPIKEVDSL